MNKTKLKTIFCLAVILMLLYGSLMNDNFKLYANPDTVFHSDGFETGALATFWDTNDTPTGHSVTSTATYVRSGTYGVNSTSFDYPQSAGWVSSEIETHASNYALEVWVKPNTPFTDSYYYQAESALMANFYNITAAAADVGASVEVWGNTTGYYLCSIHYYDLTSGISTIDYFDNNVSIALNVWSNITLAFTLSSNMIVKAYLNDVLLKTSTLTSVLSLSTNGAGAYCLLGFWGRNTGFDDFVERGDVATYPPSLFEDYEDGNIDWRWDAWKTPVTTYYHSYNHSYEIWGAGTGSSNKMTTHITTASVVDVKLEGYFYLPSDYTMTTGIGGRVFLYSQANAGGVGIHPHGNFGIYNNGSHILGVIYAEYGDDTEHLHNLSTVITKSIWHHVTVTLTYADSGAFSVTLDDVNVYSESGDFWKAGQSNNDIGIYVGCLGVSGTSTSSIFFDDVSSPDEAPLPTPTPTPTPVVQGGTSLQYYFRSDTYTTLGVSAYGLDSDYTNAFLTSNVTFPVYYGFRVWLVSSSTISTELTNSTPTAYIYLNGSETYDSYSSTWLCPETTVNLGYQALKITVYASADLEEWTALASYITPVLITKQIEESTWTFTLQVAFDGANAVYSWGDTSHRSGISGITFTEPLESEIQLWRINTGDYAGFILGAYIDVIGEAFYVLCLIGAAGTLYFRYRNFGVIVFFFSIFGGVGGLVWFLVPPWAAAVASALIIIGTSFIVWRVIR